MGFASGRPGRRGWTDVRLRGAIERHFTWHEIKTFLEGDDRLDGFDNLSFGEYPRILQRPEHWEELGWRLDAKVVLDALDDIREMRNQLMHFRPGGEIDTDRIKKVLALVRDVTGAESVGVQRDREEST